jgi:hypothetical protein
LGLHASIDVIEWVSYLNAIIDVIEWVSYPVARSQPPIPDIYCLAISHTQLCKGLQRLRASYGVPNSNGEWVLVICSGCKPLAEKTDLGELGVSETTCGFRGLVSGSAAV